MGHELGATASHDVVVGGMTPGSFLYFAYGSNMGHLRLRAPSRAPSATFLSAAMVRGRELTFDKVGQDGSGKCDCAPASDSNAVVWGCVFEVAERDRATLDRAEGKGYGYDAATIEVETPSGIVVAHTYLATRKSHHLKPFDWYKQHVMVGAKEAALPENYIARIVGAAAVPDPDDERRRRELAIYL